MIRLWFHLLIVLFLFTSWLAPICQMDCHWAHKDLRQPTPTLFSEHCPQSPATNPRGQGSPSGEHPCQGGFHQRVVLSAALLLKFNAAGATFVALPARVDTPNPALSLAPGDGTAFAERFAPPVRSADLLPLRI